MNLAEFLAYAVTGAFAGLISGLFGVGGGIVTVPSLVLIFKFFHFHEDHAMHFALGTSMAAMVFTSVSSAREHYKQGSVRLDLAKRLFPGICAGALCGALLAVMLPGKQLELIFGIFLFLAGLRFLLPDTLGNDGIAGGEFPLNNSTGYAWGTLIGMLSTFFGIGGGIITVPFLRAYRIPLKNAISTSAFTGCFISLFGAFCYFFLGKFALKPVGNLGYIHPTAFFLLAVTSALAAPLGARWTHSIPAYKLKKYFGFILLLSAARIILGRVVNS